MTQKNDSNSGGIGCLLITIIHMVGMGYATYLAEKDRIPQPPTITYKPVIRVFLHEHGHASFFVNQDHEIKHIDHGNFGAAFIPDVLKDEPMWALYDTKSRKTFIHIHDVKEVNSGSLDHGKFGQGTTNVIE